MTRCTIPQPGLLERLRALAVGESCLVPNVTYRQVDSYIRTACKGGRWFTSRTLTIGTRIQRYE